MFNNEERKIVSERVKVKHLKIKALHWKKTFIQDKLFGAL